jgi:hypothetical protein
MAFAYAHGCDGKPDFAAILQRIREARTKKGEGE